ncbi:4-alpha-glucanotransferase [Actinoalloteichus hoggarensis]|uniref:4-alpha-glucanotransferase n=1 Tax=Actinoalloteichus hoggarensis TaxID=1470176 RepID=A0A221VZJ1_9PSEU|nr:4-alpha-glucanotransferase [Actinoalloteichus hoggarensis]ASO18945.1 4-alpha-glucanotransferase [Actinoalloteichus hoggarensis]MBB5920181.1 4-alpha-glucanotransferase [Actinoalloteichus hoggarensis]
MNEELAALAEEHGVATWYEDWRHQRVDVDPTVVVAVLGRLGVDASTPVAVRAALAAAAERRSRMPATIVLRQGESSGLTGPAVIELEDGRVRAVVDRLPTDLPLGWHRLRTGDEFTTLVVAPRAVPRVPRAWGWMVQLYALHSTGSWGIGDYGDLRELLGRSATELGADVVLLNPLHAPALTEPVQPSPYSPSSRRFANPLYLRIAELAEYQAAPASVRERIDALAIPAAADRIDYDAVWQAKQAALELLWPSAGPLDLTDQPALRDFATFAALAERHGADWRDWPADLRDPRSPAVDAARAELADRVGFHAWSQRCCVEQLDAAHRAGRDAGMRVGVIADLAVGVTPDGADSWALQDVLATEVSVGAPPDDFNQQGQRWGLPPWRPDRLAELGYAPYRDMLRAVLSRADGIRIDHVLGLWRLWWVPPGETADRGTYVRYDADAMLGILALEAVRAGAVVIGEDLGTVPDGVTEALHEREILSSSVLWFQRAEEDDPELPAGTLLPPSRWREFAAASVSTHDLPTAAGFLRGEHVRVRAELGVLTADIETERARADAERAEFVAYLSDEGVLPVRGSTNPGAVAERTAEPSEEEIILAMHALLARTPARLLFASPYDLVGEPRQPNLPGTVDEYPNWRLPLPVTLDELLTDPRVRAAAALLRRARPR